MSWLRNLHYIEQMQNPSQDNSASPRHNHWPTIVRTQEFGILLISFCCIATVALTFLFVSARSPAWGAKILSVVVSHLTAGRAAGVSLALSLGFTRVQAIGLGSLVEGAVVCMFFPIFSLSFKKLISVRFLTNTMASVQRSAAGQRKRLLRWGIPGLIAFVWFPFFMTGPVVGSVIGFLLGMRPWVITSVVLSGTTLAIVSWTFAMGPILHWATRIGEFIPLMFVLILLVLAASYRISRYIEAQQKQKNRGTPHPSENTPAAK